MVDLTTIIQLNLVPNDSKTKMISCHHRVEHFQALVITARHDQGPKQRALQHLQPASHKGLRRFFDSVDHGLLLQ